MIHISRQFREICIVSPHSATSPQTPPKCRRRRHQGTNPTQEVALPLFPLYDFLIHSAKYFKDCVSSRSPCVSIDMTKRCASQKKLAGLPGGAEFHDGGGGKSAPAISRSNPMSGNPCSMTGGGSFCVVLADGGRLSRRIHSTVTPKKSAICDNRVSSGVRLPRSHGDHCCGDTPNASAHFFSPPRPGNFFCLHSSIFRAMISRS